MSTIVSLVNIHHHTYLQFFSCDENFKIYCLSNSQIHNIVLLTIVTMLYITHPGLTRLFFFLINSFIYLFLAALGLCCCMRVFSSCGEVGLFFVVVRGLLLAVASLIGEHGL